MSAHILFHDQKLGQEIFGAQFFQEQFVFCMINIFSESNFCLFFEFLNFHYLNLNQIFGNLNLGPGIRESEFGIQDLGFGTSDSGSGT